jgi:hypothetical protein
MTIISSYMSFIALKVRYGDIFNHFTRCIIV